MLDLEVHHKSRNWEKALNVYCKSPSTFKNYKRFIKAWLDSYDVKDLQKACTEKEVQNYIRKKEGEGMSVSSKT